MGPRVINAGAHLVYGNPLSSAEVLRLWIIWHPEGCWGEETSTHPKNINMLLYWKLEFDIFFTKLFLS